MKRISKIICIILLAILLIVSIQQNSFATTIDNVFSQINPDRETTNSNSDELKSLAGKILGVMQVTTVIVGMIIIGIIGFKTIMASADEKADYKKAFIPLVIGIVVLFSATSIAKLIFGIIGKN